MNNAEYKQQVLTTLDMISLNTQTQLALKEREKDIRSGQAIHRQRKARRRDEFLQRLEMVRGSKWRANGRCECGTHCAIELVKGSEVVGIICPYTYWALICALLIEERGGSETLRWQQDHPRGHFVRPITE